MYQEKNRTMGAVAKCPACEARIVLGRKPRIGQGVICTTCKERLEVVWLNPIELDWLVDDDYDDPEDW
jgi:lysine biosynthesis protein LysW